MSIISKVRVLFNPKHYVNAFYTFKIEGANSLYLKAKNRLLPDKMLYKSWLADNSPNEKIIQEQKNTSFEYSPKISIIVPAYDTKKRYLEQLVASVKAQTYSNWELCISAYFNEGNNAKEYLENLEKSNNNIKLAWNTESLGISENTNKALSISNGEYCAFLDHDDIIECNALFEVVKSLQNDKHDLIYTDEDFVTENLSKFLEPSFKPDWSPDLLRSHNYITHFLVLKKSLIEQIGSFDSSLDGAQDFDFIFRCVEYTNNIYHIPKVLYHWRINEKSVAGDSDNKKYAYVAGKKAIEKHLERIGANGEVSCLDIPGFYHITYNTKDNPLVSIIIPNKDNVDLLKECVDSLYNVNIYKNFELIICENNSEEKKTFKFYEQIENQYKNLKVIKYSGAFNYSLINNFAAKEANGDYLLFLNNDTKMIKPNSLSELLGYCMRPHVGAVGAKLLYEDRTIQHAGVVIGFGGSAGNMFDGQPEDTIGYKMRPRLTCNYSAVTAACMMTKTSLFNEVGGFTEKFQVALNDVDYCLKLGSIGKYVVYDPESIWFHYESKTRGFEDTKEKKERYDCEKSMLQDKWPAIFKKGDPFYNRNFSFWRDPFRLNFGSDIVHFIDKIKIGEKEDNLSIEMIGWSLSRAGNKVSYKVLEDSKEISIKYNSEPRPELFTVHMANEAKNQHGYRIKFNANKKSTYTIVVYTANSQRRFKYTYRLFVQKSKEIDYGNLLKNVDYQEWFENHKASKEALKEQSNVKFTTNPKFSIVIPLYKTNLKYLKLLVSSIRNQSYQNWELCFSDGSGQNSKLYPYLNKLSKKDKRIKFVYREKQLDISNNTNEAIGLASGDYIVFSDHDDLLAHDALFEIANAIDSKDNVDIVYTDEDKITMDGKKHFMPHFKPDFNLDLLRSENYICHIFCVKKELLDKVGLLRSKFNGAQDYDVVLRCTEKAKNIVHIPKILYHWRAHVDSTAGDPDSKNYAFDAGKEVLLEHYSRLNMNVEVSDLDLNGVKLRGLYRTKFLFDKEPLLSIIIPNKDHTEDLDKCINSLLNKNDYQNFEIIVVENNSEEKSTFDYYENLQKKDKRIKVCKWPGKGFNYPSINNYGFEKSIGEYILFLNNDTEIDKPDSIRDMMGYCLRDDVGAVGAKLLYEDNTIQHCGVILKILGVAAHVFVNEKQDFLGYFGRAYLSQDLSAVTAACMMLKRSVFDEVEMFDNSFAVAFNDIDLCMKIRKAGHLIVCDNFAQLHHYESKSRGYEDSAEKVMRFNSEIEKFQKKWSKELDAGDPYYNPNLTLEATDFSLGN